MSTHDDSQRKAFDLDAARHLATVRSKSRTYAKKATICVAALGTPRRLLEMGCGGGFFTAELARLLPGCGIVATDPYPAMLEAAASQTADLQNVIVRPLENGDRAFDAVCAVDVIHHLEDPARSLAEWRARVRPGGLLVACEANPENPVLSLIALPKREERRFFLNRPSRLARWLSEAGWADVAVTRLPLYLPPGPAPLYAALDRAENALHKLLRGAGCGSFLLRARNL
ncbi:MAG TPA: class I SAM-dependent methyltransferase [Myxococcales bacterium]|nr:class I SAM-dependent methyltransferase [Myxococcales bacterium]